MAASAAYSKDTLQLLSEGKLTQATEHLETNLSLDVVILQNTIDWLKPTDTETVAGILNQIHDFDQNYTWTATNEIIGRAKNILSNYGSLR